MKQHETGPPRTRLVVTGFGPYPGVPANPTGVLARTVARDRRLRLGGIEATAAIFETRYSGIGNALGRVLDRVEPDVCLHLGLAPRARTVRVEVLAENRARPLSPDASGQRPRRRRLVEDAHDRLAAAVMPERVRAKLRRAGVPAVVSRDAGANLCNAVYFLSLAAARGAPGRLVLFIHIPRPAPHPGRRPVARPRRSGPSRPALADLARVLAAIALLLRALHREGLRRAAPRA